MENQNTKGFTLLELIVVVAIIGAISAVGIPNFLTWSADRKVRSANDQVAGLITRLNTQTQRGVFPFVQLSIGPQDDGSILIEARGKNKGSINTLLNAGGNLACNIDDNDYWTVTLANFTVADISAHFGNLSAVCFSKNADDYMTIGDIEDNEDNPLQTDEGVDIVNYIIFCSNELLCNTTPAMPAYMVVWSIFGNVTKFKYNSNDEWIRQ
tara:strand:+ start:144 stop:776 length:633 start_codon:yes stop_codon:yes gene_type:complete